jgi:hypothetical protein
MSARNIKSTTAYVPCCKVCKDAGEPENVYSSHYVKDREGNVTCPKLKAIVCLKCGKRGHTSSYCKVPPHSRETAAAAKAAIEAAKKPVEPKPANSRFACLFEDDSDDEKLLVRKHSKPAPVTKATYKFPEVTKEKAAYAAPAINVSNVFDFPSLTADTKTTVAKAETKAFSYANMAAKPAEVKPIRQAIVIPTRPASPITAPPRSFKRACEYDWAMEEESDSDSDYEA